ncbi:DUF4291 domain-containing protein [Actinomadura sp. PM05-2]|uniref:DUF4291 domain-containing protein n=2 Tax=Actinomadura parmotrematis TaxID=2864039 RepID=A0ABS7G2U3_9ACTN|nr:DUF4291 domain-containing protein [Actinomadura parmotrematis]
MTNTIRARYDSESITVYQAYAPAIAEPAVAAGHFIPPFSRSRMTWIKPSFLWLMARSGWARKPGQEMILAIRITRTGWEEALSQAALSHPDRRRYTDTSEWRRAVREAPVRIQWDPERSLRGAKLEERSIQVGLSRHIVASYVDEWTLAIEDLTPLARRIHRLLQDGKITRARALLPAESPYPLPPALADHITADKSEPAR